ncbi:hypothetical protein BZA77DRAFT_357414 [Pyronema omphalodes]|nr:hypothetical protein BZA77DRAFT_357414 [Pyronema omphalodes]
MDQEIANEMVQLLCAQVQLLNAEVGRLNALHTELAVQVGDIRIDQVSIGNQATLGLDWLQRLYHKIDTLLPFPAEFAGEARPGLHNTFAQNDVLSEQIAQLGRHQRMSSIATAATQTQLRAISSQLHVIQSQMQPTHQQRTGVSRPSPDIRSSAEPDLPEVQAPAVIQEPLGDSPDSERSIKSEPDLSRDPSPLPELYPHSNPSPSPDPEWDTASIRLPSLESESPYQLSEGPEQPSETDWSELPPITPAASPSPPPSPASSRKRKSSSDTVCSSPRASKIRRLGTPTLSEIDWVSEDDHHTNGEMDSNADVEENDRNPPSSPPASTVLGWIHPYTPSSRSSSLRTESYVDYNEPLLPELQSDSPSSPPESPRIERINYTPSNRSSSIGSESYVDYNQIPSPELVSDATSSRLPSLEPDSVYQLIERPFQFSETE